MRRMVHRVIPSRTRALRGSLPMLNRRLYLQAWLVAVVALLVAFLTLEPPPEEVEPNGVATFTASDAVKATNELAAVAPQRASGTPGAEVALEWVRARFAELVGEAQGDRVATQPFVARILGDTLSLNNVFFTQPAAATTKSQRNILIVAPRDTPRGVASGASSTAILVELARTTAKSRYRHRLIFLSADGTSLGNAGLRWYLSTVEPRSIAGVIVVDAPGEGTGRELHIWSGGSGRQALALRPAGKPQRRAACARHVQTSTADDLLTTPSWMPRRTAALTTCSRCWSRPCTSRCRAASRSS